MARRSRLPSSTRTMATGPAAGSYTIRYENTDQNLTGNDVGFRRRREVEARGLHASIIICVYVFRILQGFTGPLLAVPRRAPEPRDPHLRHARVVIRQHGSRRPPACRSVRALFRNPEGLSGPRAGWSLRCRARAARPATARWGLLWLAGKWAGRRGGPGCPLQHPYIQSVYRRINPLLGFFVRGPPHKERRTGDQQIFA